MAWYKRRVNRLWLLWLASWRSLGAWLYQLDRAIFYYKESTGNHGRHFFLSVSSQYWPCVYPVLLRALPNATSLTIGTIINNNPSISLPSLGSCTCASHLSVFVPVSGIVYKGSHLAGGRIWCWSLAFRTKIPLLVGIYITLGYDAWDAYKIVHRGLALDIHTTGPCTFVSDHRQTTVHLQNDMINMVAEGVMQSFNGTMICVLFMPTWFSITSCHKNFLIIFWRNRINALEHTW